MGYKAKLKTYLIRFEEGHEYHGAEACLRGISFAEWEEMTGLDGGDGDDTGAKSVQRFVDHLISWNIEDEHGQAVPTTLAAAKSLDHDLVTELNNAWVKTLTGVHNADPLPQSSLSGEPSLVESVPMEALSPSLAS